MTNYIVRLFLDLVQDRLPKGKLVKNPKLYCLYTKSIQLISFNPK
jgi:hypothetical protein